MKGEDLMKLYVDDRRPCPEGFVKCENAKEAIALMSSYDFDTVSLDYDLGYGEDTGLDILIMMKGLGKQPKRILIHSSHPIGRERMFAFASENFPSSEIVKL